MTSETRSTDAEGRIYLPEGFANATVIVEQVSDTEVRIRKSPITLEEIEFSEETVTLLTDRDRDRFLELLDNPPEANAALRLAAEKRDQRHD